MNSANISPTPENINNFRAAYKLTIRIEAGPAPPSGDAPSLTHLLASLIVRYEAQIWPWSVLSRFAGGAKVWSSRVGCSWLKKNVTKTSVQDSTIVSGFVQTFTQVASILFCSSCKDSKQALCYEIKNVVCNQPGFILRWLIFSVSSVKLHKTNFWWSITTLQCFSLLLQYFIVDVNSPMADTAFLPFPVILLPGAHKQWWSVNEELQNK